VEATIAASILLVVLLAGFLALDSAQSATKGAERQAIAASVGEREIERLTNLPWNRLAHCTAPTQQVDPLAAQGKLPENPRHYIVNGTPHRFRVLSNYRNVSSGPLTGTPSAGEPLVIDGALSCASDVDAGPVSFSSGGVTGSTYRFITWRDDTCPPQVPAQLQDLVNLAAGLLGGLLNSLLGVVGTQTNLFCSASNDSKRITVAVVLDDVSGSGPYKPTWLSTIHTNPTNSGLILGATGQYNF
jgi:hypothetical protein